MFSRKERTMRDNFGGIVTCNRIRTARNRIGFEKKYFPGLNIGRFGWERAHETGNSPITAGPEGIVHAPSEVTHFYQRLGIEQFLMTMFSRKASEVEIWMSTTVYTHPGTLRVRKIVYRVDAVRQKSSFGLYQAIMTIENEISNPVISTDTELLMSQREWYRVLK
jgi:hypothetical protein